MPPHAIIVYSIFAFSTRNFNIYAKLLLIDTLERDPIGIEVLDANTNEKIIDLGLRALQTIPSDVEEPIVLYNPNNPVQYLSLIPYAATFYVHFDSIRTRFSGHIVLSLLTGAMLAFEFMVLLTIPVWGHLNVVH